MEAIKPWRNIDGGAEEYPEELRERSIRRRVQRHFRSGRPGEFGGKSFTMADMPERAEAG